MNFQKWELFSGSPGIYIFLAADAPAAYVVVVTILLQRIASFFVIFVVGIYQLIFNSKQYAQGCLYKKLLQLNAVSILVFMMIRPIVFHASGTKPKIPKLLTKVQLNMSVKTPQRMQ